ncbi:MAG TPA: HD domain-containing phosphohydrolase [Sideroxyarcus sp.]|nr:HD domain-containing phosphohydrolase [Sideroxyarcus sp.]
MDASGKSSLLRRLTPASIALLYMVLAALWIVGTGALLGMTVADVLLSGRIELIKGVLFVCVTGLLLYLLLTMRETNAVEETTDSPLWPKLALVFALVLAVPLLGFVIISLYTPQVEHEAYANLEAIARLKAEQVENWLDERQGDTEILAGDERLAELAGQLVKRPQDEDVSRRIQRRLDLARNNHRYTRILLLDTEERLLLESADDFVAAPALSGLLRQALAGKRVLRRDLHRDNAGDIHMEWVVPLVVQDAQGERAVAGLELSITAHSFIFPLIQTWPTASASGEILLVRREGDSVMFLNDLRHRGGTALTLAQPMTDSVLPAAIALRSAGSGTTPGMDYRGVPVVAAYRPVAGTEWYIVAKIDRSEMMAPLQNLVLWVSLIALAALAAVSLGALLVWRQQRRAYRLEMRERSMAAIERSERHFRSLFENMLEGYAFCRMLRRDGEPEDFVYLEVNPAFEILTGLKGVAGRLAGEVLPGLHESNPELLKIFGRVVRSGLPERFESYVGTLQEWFSISVYCPEPEHFVTIFDNITERKRTEQVLADSEQRFRSLVEQSIAGIYIFQDGLLVYVNPRFAEIFGYATVNELIGAEPALLVAEQDKGLVAENMRRQLDGEAQYLDYSFAGVRKDGGLIEAGVHGARATHRGRPAVIGLLQDISEKKHAEEQIRQYVAQLEKSFLHTVEVATTLTEMRDPYTAGHEKRVAQIAVAIGTELGLDAHRIEGLRVGGYVHDIGKIIVPAEILSKPARPSSTEYSLIKEHPQAGYDILKNATFPWPVADIAYQHHERLDGSGYPRGLKGDEILLEARITAVADVVEAMSSNRPYRPGVGLEQALGEIERGSGTHYDSEVVAACLLLFREKGYRLPL